MTTQLWNEHNDCLQNYVELIFSNSNQIHVLIQVQSNSLMKMNNFSQNEIIITQLIVRFQSFR